MKGLQKLPLFPLRTVLFPGMVLPLHIFEPRYQTMIGRCLADKTPFGVALIREGREVGGPAIPHDVGTTAHITQVERLDGGRMNIQAVGYQRFRIHSLIHEEPYLTGMIEHYPLADPRGDLAAIQALLPKLKAELRAYLVTLEEATGSKFSLNEIPGDGMAIAFLTAIVLPLPLDEKQQLLASETLLDMLTLGHRLLRREAVLLREARIVPAPLPEVENPFSPN